MGQGQMAATNAQPVQDVDQALLYQLEGVVSEASERVTFHSVERERWGRTGLAAAAALEQLRNGEPLTVTEPDDFFRAIRGDDQPQPAVSVPAGAYVA